MAKAASSTASDLVDGVRSRSTTSKQHHPTAGTPDRQARRCPCTTAASSFLWREFPNCRSVRGPRAFLLLCLAFFSLYTPRFAHVFRRARLTFLLSSNALSSCIARPPFRRRCQTSPRTRDIHVVAPQLSSCSLHHAVAALFLRSLDAPYRGPCPRPWALASFSASLLRCDCPFLCFFASLCLGNVS